MAIVGDESLFCGPDQNTLCKIFINTIKNHPEGIHHG